MSSVIDFHQVKPEHQAIHERLENWARWARGAHSANVHPMFRQYRHAYWEPAPQANCNDTNDALEVQKIMKDLPEPHRIAVQWCYILKSNPRKVCMALGVSKDGLMELIHRGRTMAANLLRQKVSETA